MISGKEFNQQYPGKWSKILAQTQIHNRFVYKEGLNIDKHPFNEEPVCGAGGLYFSNQPHKWTDYGPLIADVSIPDDAVVVVLQDKAKADRIILANIRPWCSDEKFAFTAVAHYGCAIKYITNPSEAIQLAAVTHDGHAIQLITNPSEAVQLAAVAQNGYVIQYIDNPSDAIQLAAQHAFKN